MADILSDELLRLNDLIEKITKESDVIKRLSLWKEANIFFRNICLSVVSSREKQRR